MEVAAQKAGVSAATVYRRLQDPAFQSQLQQARTDMLRRSSGTLTAAATEAIKTLLTLLQSTSPAAVRLGAARTVLEVGIKIREAADIEERLAALEKQASEERRVREDESVKT
jgi:hypothetical protein